jgi:low temperature requirement protein LtrA
VRRQWFVQDSSGGYVSSLAAHAEHGGEERSETRNDIVLDLVYVVLLARLGEALHQLLEKESNQLLVNFIGAFVPMWLQWLHTTVFLNRFEQDDAGFAAIFVVNILLAVAMAMPIEAVVDEGTACSGSGWSPCAQLGAAICAGRLFIALCYAYAARFDARAEGSMRRSGAWLWGTLPYLIAAALWVPNVLLAGVAVKASGAFEYVWFAGVALEALGYMVLPLIVRHADRRAHKVEVRSMPLDIALLIDRQRSFMLLSVGELVSASIGKISVSEAFTFGTCTACALLGLALSAHFFDAHANVQAGGAEKHALRTSPVRGVTWSLLHIPFNASIVVLAAVIGAVVKSGGASQENLAIIGGVIGVACLCTVCLGAMHSSRLRAAAATRRWNMLRICVRVMFAALMAAALRSWQSTARARAPRRPQRSPVRRGATDRHGNRAAARRHRLRARTACAGTSQGRLAP